MTMQPLAVGAPSMGVNQGIKESLHGCMRVIVAIVRASPTVTLHITALRAGADPGPNDLGTGPGSMARYRCR